MTDIEQQELGNDVIATVNALMETVESKSEDSPNPMGMDPKELVEMFKPQLFQKVQKKPKRTLYGLAVIHQATDDILKKHAPDENPSDLAAKGMSEENE